MARLAETEIDYYPEHGYVVPNYRVLDTLLARMRDALDEVLVANPNVRTEQLAGIMTPKSSPGDTVGHQLT